jgi:hypothetical protein
MMGLGAALALLAGLLFFGWAVLGHQTPAERQRTVDSSCPARSPEIRYPAHLGGPHPAVCNPTFQTWRN